MSNEVVLSESSAAAAVHKELFSLIDARYHIFDKQIIAAIYSAARNEATKLYVTVTWENLLKIALWTSQKPSSFDVLSLIRSSGVRDQDLNPFREADISDLFPWLYYSNNFDILRRICTVAKAKAEAKIGRKKILVYCHLLSPENGKIVASSL